MNNLVLIIPTFFLLAALATVFNQQYSESSSDTIESVFQIDIKDADENNDYNVCMEFVGVEMTADSLCQEFRGSQFETYYAEFIISDIMVGDQFYVEVEDLDENQFSYGYFENTDRNPQIIEMSISDMGPRQSQEQQYDQEGQQPEQEREFDQEGAGV